MVNCFKEWPVKALTMEKRAVRMFRYSLVTGLLLTAAAPAHATDWYEVNATNTQCLNMAQVAPANGISQLATPEGTREAYQGIGETVTSTKVKDANGASIVVMHIIDSNGDHFLNFTFYPTLADCQYVLAQTPAPAPTPTPTP
jgi:hypothetical protein